MLLACPECGGRVSDKAASCPACGYPVEEIKKFHTLTVFDPETMAGETEQDNIAIEVATDFYGELLVSGDGRVWNNGGQVVARMKYKDR